MGGSHHKCLYPLSRFDGHPGVALEREQELEKASLSGLPLKQDQELEGFLHSLQEQEASHPGLPVERQQDLQGGEPAGLTLKQDREQEASHPALPQKQDQELEVASYLAFPPEWEQELETAATLENVPVQRRCEGPAWSLSSF